MIDSAAADHVIKKSAKLLLVWSPWWQKAINSCVFLYKDTVPGGIVGLSDYVIMVDKNYLFNNNIMDVAIRLEFALQQSSRSMDIRVKNMEEKYPHIDKELIGLAQSIEINSDIENKFKFFDKSTWDLFVRRDIDKSYLYDYNAENPPRLPESSWTSEKLGLPSNKKAETYLDMLVEMSEKKEQEWLDNKDNSQDESEKENDSQDENNLNRNTQEENNEYDNLNNGSTNENHHNDNPDDISYNDDVDNEALHDDNAHSESLHEKDDVPSNNIDNAENNSDSSSQDSNAQSSENDNSQSESQGNSIDDITQGVSVESLGTESLSSGVNDENSANHHNDSAVESHNNSDDEVSQEFMEEFSQSVIQDVNQADNSVMEEIIAEKEKFNNNEFQSFISYIKDKSYDNGLMELTAPTRPKDDDIIGLNEDDKKIVEKEIAEDIVEYQGDFNLPGKTSSPVTEFFSSWSKKRLKKPKAHWKKKFPKMIQPVISQGIMEGKMDMSYSKRNPNQKDGPNQPILQGWVSFPPEVTVLIDSSPSMMKYKDTTIRELMGLLKSIFTKYSQPISILLADSNFNYGVKSMSPYSSIMKNLGRTYHGSSSTFGDVLLNLMKKKSVRVKGKVFNRPDILVVFTDCIFHWPLMDKSKLPGTYPKVLIISVKPYDEVKEILPAWVKENRNFVYADK